MSYATSTLCIACAASSPSFAFALALRWRRYDRVCTSFGAFCTTLGMHLCAITAQLSGELGLLRAGRATEHARARHAQRIAELWALEIEWIKWAQRVFFIMVRRCRWQVLAFCSSALEP